MAETVIVLSTTELEGTFGVLFIGYILTMVAYGFTFFQTYTYYSRFPLDHRGLKAMVLGCDLITASGVLLIPKPLMGQRSLASGVYNIFFILGANLKQKSVFSTL
ncbi:hypothetical protein JR316_0007053 [Psilocybe cubensis]|uniref:Uncharacterized protein n=1 Tax=Psilocybe cubensis TaxID=181762 RepID=A0ACB8GXI2_PSICU|nr:hypothetical protein JR316_0007053 [Psilocybe cubensis]KAH9480453.1 hypothetical protein JR316_0007053 [Psilocybe cubensis]